ncbi:hypothetical protein D3C87_2004950 [compost metagenome]
MSILPPGIRLSVGAGFTKSFALPNKVGFNPKQPVTIFPFVPTNKIPPSGSPIITPGVNSSGLGGIKPPSYQYTSTSGILTLPLGGRAGKVYLTN